MIRVRSVRIAAVNGPLLLLHWRRVQSLTPLGTARLKHDVNEVDCLRARVLAGLIRITGKSEAVGDFIATVANGNPNFTRIGPV